MKKYLPIIIILALFLNLGCRTINFKAPPGQVKKATGTKSAQPFAPGQQKRRK